MKQSTIHIPRNSFLVVRAIKAPSDEQHPNVIVADDSLPKTIQSSPQTEQEVRLIHTTSFTWSLPSNTLFTQQILKQWKHNTNWHMSIIQTHSVPFTFPKLNEKNILFSEKEMRSVGTIHGIQWIHSKKGFRFIVRTPEQYQTLLQKKLVC